MDGALVCMSGGVEVVLYPGPVHSCHFIGCVCTGCGYRSIAIATVGGRCAVVWLASEWLPVVCAVCVAHGTQGGPLFMHKVPVSHCSA